MNNINLLLRTFTLCSIFLGLLSCTGERGDSGPKRSVLDLKIVHSPDLTEELDRLAEIFESSNPTLPDGLPIKLELLSQPAIAAAKSIANGELKTHAWLASSLTLVNYTNSHLTNLGPQQVGCKQVFATPIVVAVSDATKKYFNALGQKFSWKEFFDPRIEQGVAARNRTTFFHGSPLNSVSGFGALMQLAYLSAFKRPQVLDLETLKADATFKRLGKYEEFVASYFSADVAMLERVSRADGSRPVFALTTEQQLAQFNLNKNDAAARLTALYPTEGSYWENFNLCLSDADWVSAAHRAAMVKFSELVESEQGQFYFKQRGFRPSTAIKADLKVLSTENGVDLSLPAESFLPAPGEVAAQLINSWSQISRPSATLVVLDASGSMEDAMMYSSQAVRNWVASTSKRDKKALLSFNSDLRLDQPFTDNNANFIAKLDSLRSVGGSAVFDAIKRAFDMMGDQELVGYRKNIVLLTDGDDKNSQISLELLSDLVKQRANSDEVNFSLLAIRREGSDNSSLRRIAKDAHGAFKEITISEMSAALQEAFSSL